MPGKRDGRLDFLYHAITKKASHNWRGFFAKYSFQRGEIITILCAFWFGT
jgi:hypothetical protein